VLLIKGGLCGNETNGPGASLLFLCFLFSPLETGEVAVTFVRKYLANLLR